MVSLLSMSARYSLKTHTLLQFNCVKEMTLPEVAEAFQAARYNVLLYDARSVEGQWRTTAEPPQPTTNGRRFIRWV